MKENAENMKIAGNVENKAENAIKKILRWVLGSKKNLLIVIIATIVLVACALVPILIVTNKNQEREDVYDAFEAWSKGRLNGIADLTRIDVKKYAKDDEGIEKAIAILNDLKDDPQNFVNFMQQYNKWVGRVAKVQDALETMELSVSTKIEFKKAFPEPNGDYIVMLTKEDVEEHVREKGQKNFYVNPGRGGYYDGNENTSFRNTVGIEGSPLYDAGRTTFLGDFRIDETWGVTLDDKYKEVNYSDTTVYFRGLFVGTKDPRNCDGCYYIDSYLIFCYDGITDVCDLQTEKIYSFSAR